MAVNKLDISMIEKNLWSKFQLVGMGINSDFYTEGNFFNFIHSLNNESYSFGQTWLYLNKKFTNKPKKII